MIKNLVENETDLSTHQNLKEKTVAYFLVGSFIVATIVNIYNVFNAGHDSWTMTEWLINYAGGFVRRGLPGEIIYRIKIISGFRANYIVIAISAAAFLFVIYKISFGIRGILPFAIIFSPVILGSAAYGGFIFRKDILGIVFLILCLHFFKKKYYSNWRYFLINIVGIFAILSHETFFFFGFPALVLAGLKGNKINNSMGIRPLAFAIVKLLPMIIAFFAVAFYHGNSSIAYAINNSWSDTWVNIDQGACCLDQPSTAIEALQWSTQKGIAMSLSVLNEFSGIIYVPLVWVFTLAGCFWFLVGFVKPFESELMLSENVFNARQGFATVLVFQLIMISPLFLVGWDFGRWIFLWVVSSIIIYNFELNYQLPVIMQLYDKLRFVNSSKFMTFAPRYWHLLFFSVPPCCWSVDIYISTNPIGYLRWLILYVSSL